MSQNVELLSYKRGTDPAREDRRAKFENAIENKRSVRLDTRRDNSFSSIFEMKVSRKRQKRTILKFDDLPPRVIIDILSNIIARILYRDEFARDGFYCVDIGARKKFGLFGYFKRDGLRHIWQIFLSVNIDAISHINQGMFIQSSKIRYLSVSCRGGILDTVRCLWKKVLIESPNMLFLKKIRICLFGSCHIENPFRQKGGFPALKHFEIKHGGSSTFLWRKPVRKDFWSKLESYKANGGLDKQFFHQKIFTSDPNGHFKLRKLHLERNSYSSTISTHPRVVSLVVPNLEELTLIDCKNIGVECGKKIRKIKMKDINMEYVERVYRASKSVESIDLTFSNEYQVFPGIESLWIFDPLVNPLSSLKEVSLTLSIETGKLFKCPFYEGEKSFGNMIEKLSLSAKCINMKNEIFYRDYPELKSLQIGAKIGKYYKEIWPNFLHHVLLPTVEKHYPLWERLKELKIYNCDVKDEIFQNNFFSNLEKLVLFGCKNISGRSRFSLPKLKTLKLFPRSYLYDEFFRKNDFPNLVSLDLRGQSKLTFYDWNFPPRLKVLKLSSSDESSIKKKIFRLYKGKIPQDCQVIIEPEIDID